MILWMILHSVLQMHFNPAVHVHVAVSNLKQSTNGHVLICAAIGLNSAVILVTKGLVRIVTLVITGRTRVMTLVVVLPTTTTTLVCTSLQVRMIGLKMVSALLVVVLVSVRTLVSTLVVTLVTNEGPWS